MQSLRALNRRFVECVYVCMCVVASVCGRSVTPSFRVEGFRKAGKRATERKYKSQVTAVDRYCLCQLFGLFPLTCLA